MSDDGEEPRLRKLSYEKPAFEGGRGIVLLGGIPGVKGGHVYEAVPASPVKPAATYLAIYDQEVDDPASLLQEMGRMGQAGEMRMTEVIDAASAQITILKQNS
jgi:hypothetical protein